jgi:hypothetical protein
MSGIEEVDATRDGLLLADSASSRSEFQETSASGKPRPVPVLHERLLSDNSIVRLGKLPRRLILG